MNRVIAVPPMPFLVTDDGKNLISKGTLTSTEDERRSRLHLSYAEQQRLAPRLQVHEDADPLTVDKRRDKFMLDLENGLHETFAGYGVNLPEGEHPGLEEWKRLALSLMIKHGDLNVCVDRTRIPMMCDRIELDSHPSIQEAMGGKTEAFRHEKISMLMAYYLDILRAENPKRKKPNKSEAARRTARHFADADAEDIRANHNESASMRRPVSEARQLLIHRVSFAYHCIATVAENIVGRSKINRSPSGSYALKKP